MRSRLTRITAHAAKKGERKIEKTVFENLKKTKYESIELSKFASWAIWDKQDIEDTKIIEGSKKKLKGNIVFVALNFGSKKRPDDWKDWQNFHGKGVGDTRLYKLLSDKRFKGKFKGAYMTDIIKNHPNSASVNFIKKLKDAEINKNINFFFKEINLLKKTNIVMYLFGETVENIFKDYVVHHKKFKTFKQKVIKCQRIDHYSGRNKYFKKRAPVQLGSVKPKNQKEKKWIYYPLWDCSKQLCPRWC